MTPSTDGVHTESEHYGWTIDVGDHPDRSDSPEYRASRAAMIKIVKATQPWFFGGPPYQDHHGGGIWVKDDTGWLLLLGLGRHRVVGAVLRRPGQGRSAPPATRNGCAPAFRPP